MLGNSFGATVFKSNEPESEYGSTSVPPVDDAQSVASSTFLDLKKNEKQFVAPPVQQEQISRRPSSTRQRALDNATATLAQLSLSQKEILEAEEFTIRRTKKADEGVALLQTALAETMGYPAALQSARARFITEQLDQSLRQLDRVQEHQCPREPAVQH